MTTLNSNLHQGSRFPIPNWASALFSSFPLITFQEAQVISPSKEDSISTSTSLSSPTAADATLPTLFVHHPHPPTSNSSSTLWPSRDPISLKYQLELTLRGIQFNCQYLNQQDSFGGPLPFLILPNPPGISKPNLIKRKELDRYLEHYLPFDYQRRELRQRQGDQQEEKQSGNPYKNEKLSLEATTWRHSLQKEVMAGVLLASLFLAPAPQADPRSGFLSKRIQSHKTSSTFTSSLSSIAHSSGLADHLLTEKAVTSNGWFNNVSWGGPAVITNGATSAMSSISPEEEEEDEEEDEDPLEVDQELRYGISQKAADLIEAIGRRAEQMEEEMEGGNQGDWFFGASSPTSLDALLFSILHTILSLPLPSSTSSSLPQRHQEGLRMSQRLRKAVESHPVLMKWTRSIWEKNVRNKNRGS